MAIVVPVTTTLTYSQGSTVETTVPCFDNPTGFRVTVTLMVDGEESRRSFDFAHPGPWISSQDRFAALSTLFAAYNPTVTPINIAGSTQHFLNLPIVVTPKGCLWGPCTEAAAFLTTESPLKYEPGDIVVTTLSRTSKGNVATPEFWGYDLDPQEGTFAVYPTLELALFFLPEGKSITFYSTVYTERVEGMAQNIRKKTIPSHHPDGVRLSGNEAKDLIGTYEGVKLEDMPVLGNEIFDHSVHEYKPHYRVARFPYLCAKSRQIRFSHVSPSLQLAEYLDTIRPPGETKLVPGFEMMTWVFAKDLKTGEGVKIPFNQGWALFNANRDRIELVAPEDVYYKGEVVKDFSTVPSTAVLSRGKYWVMFDSEDSKGRGSFEVQSYRFQTREEALCIRDGFYPNSSVTYVELPPNSHVEYHAFGNTFNTTESPLHLMVAQFDKLLTNKTITNVTPCRTSHVSENSLSRLPRFTITCGDVYMEVDSPEDVQDYYSKDGTEVVDRFYTEKKWSTRDGTFVTPSLDSALWLADALECDGDGGLIEVDWDTPTKEPFNPDTMVKVGTSDRPYGLVAQKSWWKVHEPVMVLDVFDGLPKEVQYFENRQDALKIAQPGRLPENIPNPNIDYDGPKFVFGDKDTEITLKQLIENYGKLESQGYEISALDGIAAIFVEGADEYEPPQEGAAEFFDLLMCGPVFKYATYKKLPDGSFSVGLGVKAPVELIVPEAPKEEEASEGNAGSTFLGILGTLAIASGISAALTKGPTTRVIAPKVVKTALPQEEIGQLDTSEEGYTQEEAHT